MDRVEAADHLVFLGGGGEAGALIRAFDWSRTSLGPAENWPQPLRTAVSLMLGSAQPVYIAWGPDLISLYNDGYLPIVGSKHPGIGLPYRELWAEIWQEFRPIVEQTLAGDSHHFIDMPLALAGRPDTPIGYFTFSYTALRDESGAVAGFYCAAIETTNDVLSAQRLRESEARFRTMADGAPVMMWVTDATGACTYLNARWYEFTGQTREQAEGLGWLNATHPDDAAEAERVFLQANATRSAFRLEYRLRRADGVYRWAIDAASPRFAEDGEYLGYIGSVIDIDERREAEEALAASRATLQAVFDSTPAGLVVAEHPSGRLVEANRTLETIFRHPMYRTDSADDYGNWESYDAAGRRTKAREYPLARTFATGDVAEGTYHFVRGDGTRAWLRIQTAPILDPSGAMTGGVAAVTDVDEMVRTRDALQRLTAGLETEVAERTAERDRMWLTSPDLLVVVGCDGVFRRVNPAWTAILGYAEHELLGTRFDRLVHPDDVERTETALTEAAGVPLPLIENRYRHKDGSYRWVSWITAPPEDDRIYATGRHVTAEKERQAELEGAQEALRQSQKMEAMGQLTGGVAHDFNNLLTPIVGSLDLLQRKGLGGEREQRLIAGALQSADRAKTLVQRLLAFARRQPLQASAVDMGALVTGMADLMASTSGPQIKVVVETAESMPPAKADANQIEMALLNLGVNARDAMPHGGTLRISACPERIEAGHRSQLGPGQYTRLSVADTGVGMDEATIKRAVEPFFSTKGVGKGTGLGLSMAHGLASQLGGALTIDSRPGVGTNVELWLPVSDAPLETPGSPADLVSTPPAKGTVLLVDDEELARMSTADMLADMGYAVVEAASAEQAQLLLNDGLSPDLLITDHLMPGLTGTELACGVRSDRPDIRVLIVSGYAEDEGIDADLPRLTKPFRSSELKAKLSELAAEA